MHHSRFRIHTRFPVLLMLFASFASGQGLEQQDRWAPTLNVQGAYRPDTGLSDGGEVQSTHVSLQAGLTRATDPQRAVGLGAGIGRQDYQFEGDRGFAALKPWDDIWTLSLGPTWRASTTNGWTLLVMPALRSTGESGASFEDTLTGGAIMAAAYRFHDRLTLGPGIGLFSQLEDDTSLFPFVVIDWDITDRLNFGTGRGQGAGQGPGLGLSFSASDRWTLGVGGRFEQRRFRLDSDRPAPDGVGEDESAALVALVTHRVSSAATVAAYAGVSLSGEMRLEDREGNRIEKSDTDEALLVGLTLSLRRAPGGDR